MKRLCLQLTAIGLILALCTGCASMFVPEPGFINESLSYRISNLGIVKVIDIGKDGWIKLEKTVGDNQKIEYWYNTSSGIYFERVPLSMQEGQPQE